MNKTTYQPVPVEAAARVGQVHNKHAVVILAYDANHHLMHCTTWGLLPEVKVWAAQIGDQAMQAINPGQPRQTYEDFRGIPGGTRGIDLIAAERQRQLELGYDAEHDDQHKGNDPHRHLPELVRAAVCYLARWDVSGEWPWEGQGPTLTPDDRIAELVKAGALIAAEVDRLQRLQEGGEA